MIWDKFVINELTLLVDNRVQELSPFALAFRLVLALALVASAQCTDLRIRIDELHAVK